MLNNSIVFLKKLFPVFMLNRILLLSFCIAAITIGSSSFAQNTPGTWEYYKSHFISSDGRVTDFFQNRISHSEGQGYGLLLSLHNNDKATFENILQWTKNNLMVRKDGLAAWSWGKRANGEWGVLDYNNATDGDLLISWALLKGSEKWLNSEWKSLSDATLESIKQSLVIKKQNRLILLPGYYGFTGNSDQGDSVIIRINVSYFLFPAFNQFADAATKSGKEEDKKFWKTLYRESLAILKLSLSGSMNLPSDWFNIDGNINPAKDKNSEADFSYDAIRVPLYLAMANDKKALETFLPYLKFCDKHGYVPTKVNLLNEQIAIQEASAGFHAVLGKCAEILGESAISAALIKKAETKIVQELDDYYSNTLYLLAMSI